MHSKANPCVLHTSYALTIYYQTSSGTFLRMFFSLDHFLLGYLVATPHDLSGNDTVLCPKETFYTLNESSTLRNASEISTFDRVWDLYTTVPVFLGLIMFPLLNFKSATFFTKFNSLGIRGEPTCLLLSTF